MAPSAPGEPRLFARRSAAIVGPGLFLYFPRRATEARKLRAFLDVAKEVLARGRRCRPGDPGVLGQG